MRPVVLLLLFFSACRCEPAPGGAVTIEGAPLDFGNVLAGEQHSLRVTARNTGSGTISVESVTISNGAPFAAHLTPVTVGEGDAAPIFVTFTAPETEQRSTASFSVLGRGTGVT